MPTTIITPTEIKHVLYEGQLEFTSQSVELVAREKGVTLRDVVQTIAPIVSLGEPQWWNLAHLAREKGQQLPAEIALLLRDADFYLLLLACSFRPERESQIEWSRFSAYLRPKTGKENPIAFDLYPREIYGETKTDVKVSIAPSLKFATAEGKLGEAVTTIELNKIEPVIIGYGALQSDPGWDFEKHSDRPLRGSKFCYLIVKRPYGAEAVRLTLDITAEVATRHGLLSAKVAQKDSHHLSRIVCND